MHCDWFDIYFLLVLQNKGFYVYEPPISCLILDKITNKFHKFYLQIPADKVNDILNIL